MIGGKFICHTGPPVVSPMLVWPSCGGAEANNRISAVAYGGEELPCKSAVVVMHGHMHIEGTILDAEKTQHAQVFMRRPDSRITGRQNSVVKPDTTLLGITEAQAQPRSGKP